MLSIDTSYVDDRETKGDAASKKVSLSSMSPNSRIRLKSPKYGIHPNPSEQQNTRKQHRRNNSGSGSMDYSNHSRSSKNSRATKSSGEQSSNDNGIVISAFSNLATHSIEEGKYQQALEFYQLALQDYTKDASKTTVVELVNAAATCFNLGALAKKIRDYPKAADYFAQAQEIYLESGVMVESYVQSLKANGPMSPMGASSISSANAPYSCQVCLLQLIVETLQARAHLHYKYQSLVDEAMECHEEAIYMLNNDNHDFPSSSLEHDVVHHKIHFTMLPQRLRWQLLVTSLQALGKFYLEKGRLEDALTAYQDTLSTLKKLHEFQVESTTQRQEEILQILGALSQFFLQKHIDSTNVVMLERAAYLQEDLGRWEKAMQCWERILYCQSKEYGENSVEVSVALGQLARVMVLEGNLEGALDLYKATADISLRNAKDQPKNKDHILRTPEDSVTFSIPEEIFGSILDVYDDLDRLSDAIDWLKSLLSRSERREDQARIQLELGKLYLHQGFVHEAQDALYLSTELFDGEDDSAFELLQRMEVLGQDENPPSMLHSSESDVPDDEQRADAGLTGLTAIMEDGESDSLTEGTSAPLSSSLVQSNNVNEVKDDDESEDLSKIMTEIAKSQDQEIAQPDQDEDLSRIMSELGKSEDQDLTQDDDADLSKIMSELAKSEDKEAEQNVHDSQDEKTNGRHEISHVTKEHDISHVARELSYDEKDDDEFRESINKADETNLTPVEDGELSSNSSASFASPEISNEKTPTSETESNADDEAEEEEIEQSSVELEIKSNEFEEGNDQQDTENFEFEHGEFEDEEEFQNDVNKLEFEQSPLLLQHGRSDVMQDTPSTEPTTNSRTRLVDPSATKESLILPKMETPKASNSKSSSPRKRISERIPRGRKGGYTEIKTLGKKPTKRRIVKALGTPLFRRSRSKNRSASDNPLVPLDEEKEVRQSMPTKNPYNDPVDEESCSSHEAPISFIDVGGASDDDQSLVSQLTFREYEMLSKKKKEKRSETGWWWGNNSEGLPGLFPSDYVNRAVEAAEGFLSAREIHERVNSRPFDFDSDEESESEEVDDANDDDEDDSLLRDSFSQQSGKRIVNDSRNEEDSSPESPNESTRSTSEKEVDETRSRSNKTESIESLILAKELELEEARKENGHEDISVATALFGLAELHLKKKDPTAAMLYARQAMKIQKATLNMPEACKSLTFMAEIHSRENRLKDALSCYSEVQRIHEALYGYFHEEIAKDLNHCGQILARQGKFDLAMDKHKEALRILKDCCGENVKNPLVSDTLIQIGAVYYKERNSLANIKSGKTDGYKTFIEGGMLEVIGRAHEDRGSYRMAIAFFEEKLQFLNNGERPKESEDVAETLNSLGMLSCRAGMYLEAIDYYDRALGIQKKLGCDDVQLAMARVLAGSVQYSLGHFNKSLKLFQDALATLRKLGFEQETVAATLYHIGAVNAALCNYDEAMSNLRDAFEIQSKLMGTEHPATFRTRREIANLYAIYASEADAAYDEYSDIIEAQKRMHGEHHPYVAETLHSMGCAQARKGDWPNALRTFEDCYNMRLKFLGMDHPQQATTLHEIAKIHLKRGRLKKAIHIIDAALHIRVESLSDQHIDVALAMATKASCLVAKLKFADANKLFMEALPIAKAAVGDQHPSVAWIQVQIGVMHLRKADFEKASEMVEEAIAIYRRSNLDDDHPGIQEATKELENIERAEMLCV